MSLRPGQADIEDFFRCFQVVLQTRQLVVKGIPTDGSALYPAPISLVFASVPHQLGEFHILSDINRAVLGAVAQVRKSLVARKPKVGRGRPTASTRKLVQQRQRLEQKIADLFTHRHLFVQRQLTATEQDTRQRISRGLPHLRALREMVEKSTASLTVAAEPKPPWPSCVSYASASNAFPGYAKL